MAHYAIIKQPVYIKRPFHQEKLHSIYSKCGNVLKVERTESEGFSDYLINVIAVDKSLLLNHKVIFEGKVNLNEYKVNDIVEVDGCNYVISNVTKSTDNKITYTVSEPRFLNCDDYYELLEECERKFEEYKLLNKYIENKNAKKKGFWASLFS